MDTDGDGFGIGQSQQEIFVISQEKNMNKLGYPHVS